MKKQKHTKDRLTMGMPKNIELSPWKSPLNYKESVESVNKQLPKESDIDRWN